MKKEDQLEKEDNEISKKKCRDRLILQNKQLYFEIFALESKINQLLQKNIISLNYTNEQSLSDQKHKQQTQSQILLIKQLKKKILLIKNAQKPQEREEMRQAIDELTFLKREKQKYITQKETLLKTVNQRQQALELNKPLQEELKIVLSKFKSTQRQNNELKTKILKLQKQVSYFHRVKQLSKNSIPKNPQNHHLEIESIEKDILKLQKEIKEIEKKWQPKIEELNNEHFALIQIKTQKELHLTSLNTNLNNIKNRVVAMREQTNILKDKLRVSQVVISPEKREQINEIYRIEKQKKQFFKQFKSKSNIQKKPTQAKKSQQISNKNQEKKLQKIDPETVEINKLPVRTSVTEIVTQKTDKIMDKQHLNFNEFELPKSQNNHKEVNHLTKKTNVAVGTTFYFNEND